jgi:hypothetical protein
MTRKFTRGSYGSKARLQAYRSLLEELNTIKANGFEDLDPDAVLRVTDYVLDRIEDYRPSA